jgi:hypothetical protein
MVHDHERCRGGGAFTPALFGPAAVPVLKAPAEWLAAVRRLALLALLVWPLMARAGDARLALDLAADGDFAGASIEFRRLALESEEARDRSGYYWAAAYAAWRAGQAEIAGLLLDRAEEAAATGVPGLMLRAAAAESQARPREAAFYYQGITPREASPAAVSVAARRLAALRVGQGDADGASQALAADPSPEPFAADALRRYQAGRDKNPWLGGALGLIPGLGYAYAGEYANAARSFLLNGLFIAGMITAADQDAWGVFAVIGFFEATWYTGSIYGGVDAAHRYNRRRREACAEALAGSSGFTPDWPSLPAVSLTFSF